MSSKVRILSIDGGGIRGIIPGQILVKIEQKLKQKTGNPEARIADYFDLIAGTSTGGILTCIYLTPDTQNPTRSKWSAQDAVNFYLNYGPEVFSLPWWRPIITLSGLINHKFSPAPIERVLATYFNDLKMSQLLKPCLIPTYDIEEKQGRFFTQHDPIEDAKKNYLVREVLRSTSAAPTYFPPGLVWSFLNDSYSLIDGGVFANNPALCAYAEVRTKFSPIKGETEKRPTAIDMVFLSLGTGKIMSYYKYQNAKQWGKIGWIRPLIDIIMGGVDETVDYQLRQIYSAVEAPDQYLRINPIVDDGGSMAKIDNVSKQNINALVELGNDMAQENNDKLDKFIEQFLL